jgi:hypothetical protein
MKKFLLPALILLIGTIGIYYLLSPSKSNQIHLTAERDLPLPQDPKELDEQEEIEQRAHHEFIMTMDPKTGDVPTERLIVGEQRAKEIMQFSGPFSPSSTNALTWTERGANNIGGRTRGLLFDASDATGNTLLAGGVGGGLWRTTNFTTTATWTQIATVSQNLAITSIAQDPQTLTTFYAGTGEGLGNADAVRGTGIYKSTDGGLTWALLANTIGAAGSDNFSYIQKILVYNNASHDIYAACRSIFCNRGGLMRSSDGGSTWTRVLGTAGASCGAASPDTRINDIEKSISGDLWVSSSTVNIGNSGKIWKSVAGGTVGNAGTWVDKTPPFPGVTNWNRIELACSPSDNNRVYALLDTSNRIGGIRRTDDGAATPATSWTNITNTVNWCDQGTSTSPDFSRGQAWYDLMLAIKPDDDNTVFAGGVDIMKTTTAGTPASWTQATQWNAGCASLPNVHADIHTIQYLPGSSTSFVVACDGGLYYTTNGGTSFTTKNSGYNVTQYYSCAIHPTAGSNTMLAGAQDNGSHRFTTAGLNNVTTASGGDGGFCAIDQKNPLQQITNFTGTTLNISNNGGTGFTYTGSFATDRFINPGDFDTASSTTPALSTAAFYYCGAAVRNFRRVTINFSTLSVASNSFTITPTTTNHSVSAIKVDPNTSNRILVAFSTADAAAASVVPQLYYIDNANTATPASTAITLPGTVTSGQYISSIDVEQGNASHILITISNYGVASIYESTDLGGSWTSLDNNGVNLSDVPVRWGMFIPAGYTQAPTAVGGILIATELGVWGTNTISGTTTPWTQNATGMGNVRTDMIKYRGSDKMIAVATHGRGLFTSQLIGALPVTYSWIKGTALQKSNKINWKIVNSTNNKGFDIERKYEKDNLFTKVGFVAAANSSSSEIEYNFEDNNIDLNNTVTFYRLKQTDLNGIYKYSDQVIIKRTLMDKLVRYVSANKNNLVIRVGNAPGVKKVQVIIYDTQGKIISSRLENFGDLTIDISSLAGGTYVVKVQSLNGVEESVNKFVK